MIDHRPLSSLGLLLWLAATMACASRTPASHLPDDAPASPKAQAARPAAVTRALDGEPPLPGTAGASAWSGLSGPHDEAADVHQDHGHAHHHGHHGAHASPPADAAKGAAGHEGHGRGDAMSPQPIEQDGSDGSHDHHGAH